MTTKDVTTALSKYKLTIAYGAVMSTIAFVLAVIK
jgi:hypothetical protein